MLKMDWTTLLSAPPTRALLPPLPPAREHLGKDKSWYHHDYSADELSALMERDTFLLPATADREDYHGDRHLDFWLSGYKDFRLLAALYEKHAGKSIAGRVVLDWGCASGRVLRHFAYQGDVGKAIGVDIKHAHTEWIRRHLDARVAAIPVTILPHLPFADATFDLVYGFSVLTHIGEFDTTWIAELSRILKPDGLLCVSILGEDAWSKMKPGFSIYDAIAPMHADFDQSIVFGPELFAQPLDRFYLTWRKHHPIYSALAFHGHTYVRRHWGRIAKVVDILPNAHDTQDIIVLRNER